MAAVQSDPAYDKLGDVQNGGDLDWSVGLSAKLNHRPNIDCRPYDAEHFVQAPLLSHGVSANHLDQPPHESLWLLLLLLWDLELSLLLSLKEILVTRADDWLCGSLDLLLRARKLAKTIFESLSIFETFVLRKLDMGLYLFFAHELSVFSQPKYGFHKLEG